VLSQRGSEASARPVARHRVADAASDRVRDARCGRFVGRDDANGDGSAARRPYVRERLEGRTVADRLAQAASRLRPRARRDLSTARPPRVRIRERNPWVFFRLRLFGWYVRFTNDLQERTGVAA
jgi:hypothetical protein